MGPFIGSGCAAIAFWETSTSSVRWHDEQTPHASPRPARAIRTRAVVGELLTKLSDDVLGELGVIGSPLQSALGLGQLPAEGVHLTGELKDAARGFL